MSAGVRCCRLRSLLSWLLVTRLRRQAWWRILGTTWVKAGTGFPRCPVVHDLRRAFGAVLYPLARIPDHHAWRSQCLPDTSLVQNPNGTTFHYRDYGCSSTKSFDPPATVAVMLRAAAAVGLEPQHGLIVACGACAWLRGRQGLLPPVPPRLLDPSFVRHCQSVGYRRSPGNLAFCVTRLIGWSRMSSWSTMVVNIQAHGSGGS